MSNNEKSLVEQWTDLIIKLEDHVGLPNAATIIGGAGSNKRRELDFYPTPVEVTHALMLFLAEKNLTPSLIWEPACGNGAMQDVLELYVDRVIGTDIQDGMDYFETPCPMGMDAVITNPPFKTSEQFIRKALNEAPLVAMVLKSQYWHAAKRATLFRERPPAYILPLLWRPDFTMGGKGSPTMDVMWTVWVRGQHRAEYIPPSKPNMKEIGELSNVE